jgi:DNA polymerase-1
MQIEDLGGDEGFENFKTSNKTLLVDADTLIFAACVMNEYQEDLLPREFYSDAEWDEIVNNPYYDSESHAIWYLDEEKAWSDIVERLLEIQGLTNTKDYELHLTSGKGFRAKVDPMYKGNRAKLRYPTGLQIMKDKAVKELGAIIHTEFESDDIVVAKKMKWPNKYIMSSPDKDVLYSVPGKHFNYYRSVQYNIEPKWVEVDAETALKFQYYQCLMGDSTDNIKGCPGIGKKRAEEALRDLVSTCDMWKKVVSMFEAKGLTIKDALRDMRLVSMHQLYYDAKKDKWEVRLWEPPCDAKKA